MRGQVRALLLEEPLGLVDRVDTALLRLVDVELELGVLVDGLAAVESLERVLVLRKMRLGQLRLRARC